MSKHSKFEVIQSVLQEDDNLLSISILCEIAGVSRSGYYRWVASSDKRAEKEYKDKQDFELILQAYNYRGYPKGAKGIYMTLLHFSVVMNIKKIRRLMNKYNLKCPIRCSNPYRRMAREIKANNIPTNILNREFVSHGARKVFLTDITYIQYSNGCCYLVTILDAYTRQVLSYELSESLEIDFVLDAVKNLVKVHKITLNSEALIHSDQGCHFTSIKFIKLLNDKGLRQSMSRKANCWDNAPQESFFGHMKDEIDISNCQYFKDVKEVIDDWIDYYNNDRYQWQLSKLSPNESYEYITTGIYPLKISKKQ